MTTLNSKIILCENIKLDREYKHVLSYSENELVNLCNNNKVVSNDKYSFIQSSGQIIVNFPYETCLKCNYMAFQNPNYSNKWFFAFVDDVIYKANASTEIKYTVDIWSTWFNKLSVKPCFVVREHVTDDRIGANTIDENIDVGDVISLGSEKFFTDENYYLAIASTYNPSENTDVIVSLYNKNIFGYALNIVKIDVTDVDTITHSMEVIIKYLTKVYGSTNGLDAISDMFIIPNELLNDSDLVPHSFGDDEYGIPLLYYTLKHNVESIKKTFDLNRKLSFEDYQPKNNKCYCYPYNYLYMTNNNGNNNILKYEEFGTTKCQFEVKGAIGVGNSVICYPKNYKGKQYDIDESMPLGKYPVCGWASDSYINWLTSQSVNIPNRLIGAPVSTALSAQRQIINKELLTKEPITQNLLASTGHSIATNILGVLGDFKMAKMLPNVTHGGNTADVMFADNKISFEFFHMRCKTEHLKVIDDYFSMFGYKVNRLKVPNIKSRQNWNYIEISDNDSIGYGNIPAAANTLINGICRRGVTIWHNHDILGDYTQTNYILE